MTSPSNRRWLLGGGAAGLCAIALAVGLHGLHRAPSVGASAQQLDVLAAVHDGASTQALALVAGDGSVPAQRMLGIVLTDRADASSVHEGRSWLDKAATAGDARALLALGKLLFRGAPGLPPDLPAARSALRLALRGGEAGAAYYLGLIEKNGGLGVAANAPEAARWLQLAAQAGVAEAQFLLGQLLLTGDGIAPDATAARTWFELAAEQEHPEANLQLLMARTRGELGFTRDDAATQRQAMEAQHSLRHRPPAP